MAEVVLFVFFLYILVKNVISLVADVRERKFQKEWDFVKTEMELAGAEYEEIALRFVEFTKSLPSYVHIYF